MSQQLEFPFAQTRECSIRYETETPLVGEIKTAVREVLEEKPLAPRTDMEREWAHLDRTLRKAMYPHEYGTPITAVLDRILRERKELLSSGLFSAVYEETIHPSSRTSRLIGFTPTAAPETNVPPQIRYAVRPYDVNKEES